MGVVAAGSFVALVTSNGAGIFDPNREDRNALADYSLCIRCQPFRQSLKIAPILSSISN
jgi:hypothetical protein